MLNSLNKQAMKRLFTIGLMLASAFALTNCAEEIAAPVQDDITVDGNIENITPPEEEVDIPFEVFANFGESAETKTVNWGNGTYWYKKGQSTPDPNDPDKESDQISVFHYNHDKGQKKFTHNKPFTIHDVETGLFKGGLSNILGATNDWYFIYPYSSGYSIDSSSGTTPAALPITIGAAKLENVIPGSKKHIEGGLYPMYGKVKNLGKESNPDIEMQHLAALVAIKVKNSTQGTIKIDDIEFGMPRIVSKDPINQTKTTIEATPLLGDCTVNLTGENISINVNGTNNYPTTKAILKESDNIEDDPRILGPNEEMTVYMAVSPIETNGKTISIKVNGSQRTLKLTQNVLSTGKVTTFKVEVKELIASQVTNAVNTIKSKCRKNKNGDLETVTIVPEFGSKILSTTINGQTVSNLYKVSSGDLLTIQGFAKDMINAMPLSFNVSACDNQPAAMTIYDIDAWMPKYDETWSWDSWSNVTDYSKLVERVHISNMSILGVPVIGDAIKAILSTKELKLTDGIQRGELLKFVDPNTITFNNLAVNGYFTNTNVVVLNENDTNKSLASGLIDTFLRSKFSLDPNNPATFVGLYAILNASYSDGKFEYSSYTYNNGKTSINYTKDQMKAQAEQTASSIFNKIKNVLDNKSAGSLISLFASDATELMHILRDVKVQIRIQPYPYAEYYEITDPKTSVNPIILWGLNAGGTTIN